MSPAAFVARYGPFVRRPVGGSFLVSPRMPSKLKDIVLPIMQCDDNCGRCCGVAPCKDGEVERIKAYAAAHGIVPLKQGIKCPFYQGGRCAIYPVRPLVCKLFGHGDHPALTCPLGYNTNIPQYRLNEINKKHGNPTRTLHEFVMEGDELHATINGYIESEGNASE